ncbi:hypothetical protein MKW11_03745 [Gluconobacter frateurii]|uniref:hypothetical protein n=1 Tax=Gluconobacter frateurii TaxID=38308 RepID=UPI001F0541B7|nr:hypothetical protein [Gluconobacter frateurii]UMM09194.1 hypothetical protein MKW11_03745 [Gluconobacter frateurii]
MSVRRISALALMLMAFAETALAGPSVSSAKDISLPPGWSFLNDPSPLLSSSLPKGNEQAQKNGDKKGASVAKIASPQSSSASQDVTGLWLPLGERTPIAAFRKGGRLVLVAGGRHPLDTAALGGIAPFGAVQSQIVGATTLVRISCPVDAALTLKPVAGGWTVSLASESSSAMQLGQEGPALTFTPPQTSDAMQVLTFQDPDSGRRLLLGLAQSGSVSDAMARRGDGFEIRPSLIGVVVAADSDALELRQASGKFFLDRIGPGSIPLLAQGKMAAYGASTAGVRLGEVSPEALQSAAYHAWISAATSIAGQRFDARIRLAQEMARLGNGPELAQILQTALEDQPEGIARSDVKRLRQIAAVLNMRPAEDLRNEEEGSAPEDQFWRGMARTVPSGAGKAGSDQERAQVAKLIAAGLPSIASYAKPLRHRLLSPAAEWVVRYGDGEDRTAFRNMPETADTALAHALLAAQDHDPGAAKRLATLSGSPSPMVWPVAREAGLRLALETGQMQPGAVGERLDALMPAFRMVGREREARLLSVDAFIKAGQWRKALQAVQDGQQLYGTTAFPGRERLSDVAKGVASHSPDKADDALTEADLLKKAVLAATGENGIQLNFLKALASRYAILGLPAAQRDTLQALQEFQQGEDAEKTNLQIARLDLNAGNLEAALHALPPEEPAGIRALPGGHSEASEVVLIRAKIALAQQKPQKALGYLQGRSEPDALQMQADVLEQQKDWRGAVAVLKNLLQPLLSTPSGTQSPLTSAESDLVLRIGADASRAHDDATLAVLGKQFSARMSGQPSASMFRLLTEGKASSPPAGG